MALLLGPATVSGQDRVTRSGDSTVVWKSPVTVKEYRAVRRAGAALDTMGELPACLLEPGTRVAVIETVEDQIVRILALDGRMRGCRGWLGTELLAPP